jgi:hypothetical protein
MDEQISKKGNRYGCNCGNNWASWHCPRQRVAVKGINLAMNYITTPALLEKQLRMRSSGLKKRVGYNIYNWVLKLSRYSEAAYKRACLWHIFRGSFLETCFGITNIKAMSVFGERGRVS